ncbi:hypothetical protein WDU94_008003 [Cyamophila willieti]
MNRHTGGRRNGHTHVPMAQTNFWCPIKENYVLAWKRGIAILTAGSTKVTPDKRIQLVDGYNLQITDLQTTDAGSYQCQIGTLEPKEITHTLEILGDVVVKEDHKPQLPEDLPKLV